MIRTTAVFLVSLCLWGACTTPRQVLQSEVAAMLDAQAEAWNRGDLHEFMAAYWENPELTFVGASGLQRGFDEVLARYQTSYPDAAARGVLRFELVEVRPVAPGVALVIGRYALDRQEPAQGMFSLVLQRRAAGLRIVHDHSSSLDG